jgi:TolB protein
MSRPLFPRAAIVFCRWSLVICFVMAIPTIARAEEIGQFADHADIGETGQTGSAEFDAAAEKYTIAGSGADMWASADAFHYLYKQASGDVTLTADVHWLGEGGDKNRKACLIVRQTLEPGSAYVDAAAHGDGHIALQWRQTNNRETGDAESDVVANPQTIRIEKRGDQFQMFAAAAGEELKPTGEPFKLHLDEPFYIGLGVCSHDNGKLETVEFTKVKIE